VTYYLFARARDEARPSKNREPNAEMPSEAATSNHHDGGEHHAEPYTALAVLIPYTLSSI
jgi:hypothetical protein